MYQLAPNIDLLFSEAGESAADRVRAAAAAGFDAVEMWGPTELRRRTSPPSRTPSRKPASSSRPSSQSRGRSS